MLFPLTLETFSLFPPMEDSVSLVAGVVNQDKTIGLVTEGCILYHWWKVKKTQTNNKNNHQNINKEAKNSIPITFS